MPRGGSGAVGRRSRQVLQSPGWIIRERQFRRPEMNTEQGAAGAPKYRRKMRNYLLDAGLQVRYTMTIVIVEVFLTAGLGYKMYQATRDISKVIELSGMA